MRILFIVLLFFLVTYHSYSQTSGKVYDLKTDKPLAGIVLMAEEGGVFAITDKEGLFVLPQSEGTFILQSLGYRDTSIIIGEGSDALFWEIGMTPKHYDLPEIHISESQLVSKTFAMNKRRLSTYPLYFLYKQNRSYKMGTSFRNQESGIISSVAFYFSQVGSQTDYHHFRLRIVGINDKGEPDVDLLRETVMIEPREAGWYTLDLKEYDVPLPGTDFLVAIELITMSFDRNALEFENSYEEYRLGMTRVRLWDRPKVSFWMYVKRLEWVDLSSRRGVPLIRVEAHIEAQK